MLIVKTKKTSRWHTQDVTGVAAGALWSLKKNQELPRGKRKMVDIPANHSYVLSMKMERAKTKAVSLPLKAMPSRLKEYLKKNIKPFLDDQGYVSFKSIKKLQRKIEGAEIEKILKTVQRKRKKRKLHPPK